MSEKNIYDPEDLEKLLQTKSFSELLPEEKAFALQFVDNDKEYDSIRETFKLFGTLPELEPAIEPSVSIKAHLMREFEEDKLAVVVLTPWEKFKTWLWDTNTALFYRPAFQLASILLVVTAGIYLSTFNLDNQVAELNTTEVPKDKDQKKASEVKKEEAPVVEKNELQSKIENEVKSDQISSDVQNDNSNESVPEIQELDVTDNSTVEVAEELFIDEDLTEATSEAKFNTTDNFFIDDANVTTDFEDLTWDVEAVRDDDDEIVEDYKGKDKEISKKLADEEAVEEYSVLEGYDIRTTQGNMDATVINQESVSSVKASGAETNSVPSSQFGLVTGDAEAQAYSAASFSNLLSKLYTAK